MAKQDGEDSGDHAGTVTCRGTLEAEVMPGPEPSAALCLTAAPSTVQDLKLHGSESPSSLEASWGSAPGGQDGYQLVLCHLESQTVVHNVSTSAGTLSYNFSHLLPGSEYGLEITTWAAHLQAKTSTRQWTGRAHAWQGPR